MNSQFIRFIILAICGVVISVIKVSYFTEKGEEIYSYTLAGISSVICYSLLYFFVYFGERYLGFNPKYKYLGTWIETMKNNKENHASIFEIKYSFFKRNFSIYGNTFNVDTQEPYAEWISNAVVFPEPHRIYYLHKSNIFGSSGDISGVTKLNFIGSNGNYFEGTGYVIDNVNPPVRIDFNFVSLKKKDLKNIINKTKISNKQDRAKLLEYFSKN
jgi:hypothetical protein